jgi:hypothetical protein
MTTLSPQKNSTQFVDPCIEQNSSHNRGKVFISTRYPISRERNNLVSASVDNSADSMTSLRRGKISDTAPSISPDLTHLSTTSGPTQRERVALQAAQKQATDRLASQNKSDGNSGASGASKEFK